MNKKIETMEKKDAVEPTQKLRVLVKREFSQSLCQKMADTTDKQQVEWFFAHQLQPEMLEKMDVLFTYHLSSEELKQTKRLKWIQLSSSGSEHLPSEEIRQRNIPVCNAAGVAEPEVGQYIVLGIMTLARRLAEHYNNQAKANWSRFPGVAINNRSILFLGTGKISRNAVSLLNSLGMNCYGVNRSGKKPEGFKQVYQREALSKILPTMDFVVNALPETEGTINFLGKEEFSRFKKGSFFLQVGRAGVVEEEALFKALQSNHIAGAMLDVHWEEPLRPDNRWYQLENVILTPHIAGCTDDYDNKIADLFLGNLCDYLKGRSLKNQII